MSRNLVSLLWIAAIVPACGDRGAEPGSGESSGTASDDRGPLGKADANGTCGRTGDDACGGQSADGCWCDEGCADFGDCCSDYEDVCMPPSGTTMAIDPDTSGDSATDGTDADDGSTTSEPLPSCDKNVVLMGYWPPTNEMLRPWSTNPEQNPDGWQGADWRGLGYDVYAFFPEFPPDGDPTNDQIGQDGAVGSPDFDLQVDYQATSEDFWRIVDELSPIILVTTSRGGQIGWEIEALEGGHGDDPTEDPSHDWTSDGFGREHFPTEATIDARSWAAISEFRLGTTVPSALPLEAIFDAATALDVASVEIDETGTSGNFLSGFLGLHGIAYHQSHAHNVAAGHIHVAIGMPADTARALMEATVQAVIEAHPAADVACP